MTENKYKKEIAILLEKIEQSDAICIGAAAGMSWDISWFLLSLQNGGGEMGVYDYGAETAV